MVCVYMHILYVWVGGYVCIRLCVSECESSQLKGCINLNLKCTKLFRAEEVLKALHVIMKTELLLHYLYVHL